MKTAKYMHRGHSDAAEARVAVAELGEQVAQPDLALLLFFCSSNYDLDALADEMNRRFAGVPVVGCTTAGEIGPAGYLNHSLVGVGFSAQAFTAETGRIDALSTFDIAAGRAFAEGVLDRLEVRREGGNAFGFLLIDGLSLREEPVTHALQDGLGAVPMIGAPAFANARARFKGVCPPNCTMMPSGSIRSQMFSTSSVVSGSKNSRSLVS